MRKIILILLSLLISTVILSGCTNTTTVSNIKSISGEKITNQRQRAMDEIADFAVKIRHIKNFPTILPKNYNATTNITIKTGKNADRLVYNLLINNPKVTMKDVIMSFSLNPLMINNIDTSTILVTNTSNNIKVNLSPHKLPKGLGLYRSFVLDKKKINKEMIRIFPELYIKISYFNNNKKVVDYFRVNSTYSNEILSYLQHYSK